MAIFCLALMGTDYPAFLREAHRVLRPGGWLWIAEVRSRFAQQGTAPRGGSGSASADEAGAFIAALEQLGFKLKRRDMSNKMFAVFELQKRKGDQGAAQIDWPELKPCMYKRR